MSIGSFRILGKLGEGAHSSILHIRRDSDGKQYALKVVPINGKEDHKFLVQAEHEFRVAQLLHHANVIKIHELETVRNWLMRVSKVHVLLDYVNGKTLDAVPRLSIPRLVQIFNQVATGLMHMHRRGVFHADLKPSNILLSRSGEVKIIDFGLAWIKGEPKDRVQGTPEYMAPEQVKKATANEQTDIYNLGATMYRLVTWRLPPSAMRSADGVPLNSQALVSLLKPVQEFTPNAPKELCELIHGCLAARPKNRPERMSDVQSVLGALEKDLVHSPEEGLQGLEGW